MNMLEELKINGERYLGVTQIGKIITEVLGLPKNISGQKMNEIFCKLSFQTLIDTKYIKFKPTPKYEKLSKKVELLREDRDYKFYFKWHVNILLHILNISLNESIDTNIVGMIKRLQTLGLVDLNEINFTKLEYEIVSIINFFKSIDALQKL